MANTNEYAVYIQDAYKEFGAGFAVLKGLNMRVNKGSIYGLLGPSGCGKTTLLSCVVGRCKLDSGIIRVMISKRKQLGYMPQELALYKEFSVLETFQYFGKLFEMTDESIKIKSKQLEKLLSLPSLKKQFNQLSGGEQRRVSLAVVLLHNPKLLVLDEPTVGLDPVLSTSIWDHLLNLCNDGKAIIITTHYIEEAKRAHCIGLMRHGMLLDEDSPHNLMLKHECSSLESTFLHLSMKQHNQQYIQQSFANKIHDTKETKRTSKEKPTMPFHTDNGYSLHRTKAQLRKQYYWIKRNAGVVLFMLFLPVAVLVIFNYAIGHPPKNVPFGIINYESKSSLQECSNISYRQCSTELLSCAYINQLKNRNVHLIEYKSINEANLDIKKNEIWGAVEFASNYSESLWERIQLGKKIAGGSDLNSNVYVSMDMSDFVTSSSLYTDIRGSYKEFIGDFLKSCNLSSKVIDIPVLFEKPIYGSREFNFSHYSMPAILILAVFYLPFIFTSSAIVMEKKEGLLERTIVSGVTLMEVLCCHMIVQVIMLILQLAMMMFVQFSIFGYPTNSNLLLPIVLLFLQGLSGTFFGLTVGFLCDTELIITLLGIGTTVPQFFISGMLWPTEGMHPILRTVSIFFPLTLSVDTLRMLLVKNWGLSHIAVYKGFVCTITWIAFFILLSIIGLRFKDGLKSIK